MAAKLPNIPLFSIPDEPIRDSTQAHLPIAEITEDLVLFKDGGAALVLESTSLNFGLLSDTEKEAVIAAYASLINSLSFSIQIVIRTQRKDISNYLDYLDEKASQVKGEKMQRLFVSYRKFVMETTRKRNVLGKRFFIIIPFSPFEMGAGSSMKVFTKRKKGPLPFTKKHVLKKAKVALLPKKDHIVRQAARLGLRLRQLDVEQITHLYYDVYNPKADAVKESKEGAAEAVAVQKGGKPSS